MANNLPFGLTNAWYTIGIATPARLAALQETWDLGEDRSTEHYRWWAFREFLSEHRPLPPETAKALYALGKVDADRGMGEAMMHLIVELPECPESVLSMARNSGIRHLIKAVEQRNVVT